MATSDEDRQRAVAADRDQVSDCLKLIGQYEFVVKLTVGLTLKLTTMAPGVKHFCEVPPGRRGAQRAKILLPSEGHSHTQDAILPVQRHKGSAAGSLGPENRVRKRQSAPRPPPALRR